jgi:hypothetical protein
MPIDNTIFKFMSNNQILGSRRKFIFLANTALWVDIDISFLLQASGLVHY